MGIVKSRPTPGHITYGTKLVLINLTYGSFDLAKIQELVTKATSVALEKCLTEIELRFPANTDAVTDAMAEVSGFYVVRGSKGSWVCNVNMFAQESAPDSAPQSMETMPVAAPVTKAKRVRKAKVSV